MQFQGGLDALRRSVRDNSANLNYYRAALSGSGEAIGFDELADIVAATPAPSTCTVTPRVAISNLVRHGALVQSAEVNGVPYKGTVEELLSDESVGADADIRYFVRRTEAGASILAEIDPATRTDSLLTDKPEHRSGFLAVLACCGTDGTSRETIEKTLRARGDALRFEDRTGLPGLSASFFTTSLEDAGALTWANGVWKATEAGMSALARWNLQADE